MESEDSNKIKTIIVDDEVFICEILHRLLATFDELEVVQVFSSPVDALLFLADHSVDLIFLDVQMPQMNGFEFLDRLNAAMEVPSIIFVTGFEEFAVKAIKRAAFDFLIKPVNPDELAETISRFKLYRNKNQEKSQIEHLLDPGNTSRRLKLNSKDGLQLINPEEILFVESEGNYSWLRMIDGRSEMVTIQIGKLQELLGDELFFRINRQNVINLRHLHRLDKKKGLCYLKYDAHIIELCVVRSRIHQLLEAV
jgi:two-component system LytT family response regulator